MELENIIDFIKVEENYYLNEENTIELYNLILKLIDELFIDFINNDFDIILDFDFILTEIEDNIRKLLYIFLQILFGA